MVRNTLISSVDPVVMFEGINVRSSFPSATCDWMAREVFKNATEAGEPMKRNFQSGGTTDIKWRIKGARTGSARFSIRRATLDSLYRLMLGSVFDGRFS